MDRLAYGLAALVGIAATAIGSYGMSGGVGTLRVAWLVPLGGLELTLDRCVHAAANIIGMLVD